MADDGPKERIEIRRYEGMYGSADVRDMKPGIASYAKNLDVVKQSGAFASLPEDELRASETLIIGQHFGVFENVGNDAMAYQNPSTGIIHQVANLDTFGALTGSSLSVTKSTDKGITTASDGLAARIGFGPGTGTNYKPQWIGYIAHEQFSLDGVGLITATGIACQNAPLENPNIAVYINDGTALDCKVWLPQAIIGENDHGQTTYHYQNSGENILSIGEGSTKYLYYISTIFDGFQESPLAFLTSISLSGVEITVSSTNGNIRDPQKVVGMNPANGDYDNATTWDYSNDNWQKTTLNEKSTKVITEPVAGLKAFQFNIVLELQAYPQASPAVATLNRRITGINIYRSRAVGSDEGEPFFLKHIYINDSAWADVAGGGGTTILSNDDMDSAYYCTYLFKDELPVVPETYEDRTQVPATLETMNLHYGLSTSVDGFHIIGQIYHPDLKEIRSWLIKSKRHAFDTFDWVRDYLVLPAAPTAIVGFSGRLYAFSRGRTHVINPTLFDVEDTWEGIGCEDQRSITVTDKGMFWVDRNNIYLHDGTRINIIGEPVLTNRYEPSAAWDNVDFNQTPIAFYHPAYSSFIIAYKQSSAYVALMYHVDSRRWTHITFENPTSTAITITGFNGVFYTESGTPVLSVSISGGNNALIHFCEHASGKRPWVFLGYETTQVGSKEKYYHLYVYSKDNFPDAVTYYEDSPDYGHATTAAVVETIANTDDPAKNVAKKYKINLGAGPPWNAVRGLAIRLDGNNGNEDVQHLTLIRRILSPR